MNMKEDKHIENLIDQMMKNQTLETPSFDFTSKVMNKVAVSQKNKAFEYKPLISKQTALLILVLAVLIVTALLLSDKSQSSRFAVPLDFSTLLKFNTPKIFSFSKISTLSISITSFMLLAQLSFLKKHFNHNS
ncbi:hypothetical protein [Flavobacterium sp. H122]|uniref:hypothetical protein n=1 Tax=Flavobacterium sp. H122 TaxID=2529860 RepID=UPI00145A1481|nr:hypothetical protein [Flavobacterium sp. H122]